MILTADVPGADTAGGPAKDEWPCLLGPSARVEIMEDDSGCLLLHYDRQGRFAGDNWFASADEARQAAQGRFGIAPFDWRARTEDETPILPALIRQHFEFLIGGYGFAVTREHDNGIEYATDVCLVTINASGIRLELREREIIHRRRAELLALVQQADPDFSLPPLPDDSLVTPRDRDGSQGRRLALLALLLREHADKMLRGDFTGQ